MEGGQDPKILPAFSVVCPATGFRCLVNPVGIAVRVPQSCMSPRLCPQLLQTG